MDKVYGRIMGEANCLFFHGLRLSDYLRDGAFWRMQCWLKGNLSYEFAALAMVLLKWNETATLFHGTIGHPGGHVVRYAWVEFREGGRKFVLDFNSGVRFLYGAREYFGKDGIGSDCRPLWYCTYKKFWAMPYVHTLWDAIQWKETSYVLRDLSGFGKPNSHGIGFEYWVNRGNGLRYSHDGGHMVPYYGENPYKIISTEVIQDFARKRTRQQPRAKSIKKARKAFRLAHRQN